MNNAVNYVNKDLNLLMAIIYRRQSTVRKHDIRWMLNILAEKKITEKK